MTRPTRLIVLDDRQGFVDALALYVSEESDLDLVATATTGPEGIDLLGRVACDVLILGDQLLVDPVPSAVPDAESIVTALRSACPGLPVVLLTDRLSGTGDGEGLLDVISDGVCGLADRSAGLGALLAAVRDVARGESHLPIDHVQALLAVRAARRARTVPLEQARVLTEREAAVLQALAAGLTRAEISVSLQLSPNTVRTHVRSILRKYHLHSAPDVVALLTEKDLTDG